MKTLEKVIRFLYRLFGDGKMPCDYIWLEHDNNGSVKESHLCSLGAGHKGMHLCECGETKMNYPIDVEKGK